MKYKYYRILPILLLSCLALSCQQNTEGSIYQPTREWKFTCTNNSCSQIDTLTLKILDKVWNITQTELEWKHNTMLDNGNNQTTIEVTGVIDQSGSNTGRVWLHPPRAAYLRRAELVPFPEVHIPVVDGQIFESNLTPGEGWKEYEGVKVNGQLKVSGKVLYKQELLQDSCWRIEARSQSSVGNYSATYFYHEKRGFVYFKYHFGEDTCEINLVRTNF